MKRLLVAACLLALLACVAIPVVSGSRGLFPLDPPDKEVQIHYGTAEDPLGWGTWVTPLYPPYDYVLVEADLTSLMTEKRDTRCSPCVPCVVTPGGSPVILHQEDPPPERPNVFYVAAYDDDDSTVVWGHIPDGYYTGFLKITWVRE